MFSRCFVYCLCSMFSYYLTRYFSYAFPHIIPSGKCRSLLSTLSSFPSFTSYLPSSCLSFPFFSLFVSFLSLLILFYLCFIQPWRLMSYLEPFLRTPDFIFILTSSQRFYHWSLLIRRYIPYLCNIRPYIQIAVNPLKYLTPKCNSLCWSKIW